MPDVSKSSKQIAQSDYMQVKALISEINNGETSDGYNPLPAAQHLWHMDVEGTTPLQRLWGWMVNHTVALGHRTAYASGKRLWDEDKQRWVPGPELHVSHVVRDLGGDAANWYRTWRLGVRRGIFRGGTEEEGEQRMYLTGKVPKGQSKETPGAHNTLDEFPTHAYKYMTDWPEEKMDRFRTLMRQPTEAEKILQAAGVQAARDVKREWQDSILQDFGIPPNRQEHQKKETDAEREVRLACLAALRPALQNCVQTVREYVQTLKPDTVQPQTEPVSLLPLQSNAEKKSTPSVEPLPYSRNTKPNDGRKSTSVNQLPAPPKASSYSEAENQAVESIYSEIAKMQGYEGFKHMGFTQERISRKRKSDQLFVSRVLLAVGPDNVESFLRHVWEQLKRLDKNALGKLPGSAPAPRSLGLILKWAVEFGEALTEAARMQAEEQKRWMDRCIAACHETINDPQATAEFKYDARKWLEANVRKDAQSA